MSCEDVTLYCAWCQRVPVGASHCCDPFDHGRLCRGCTQALVAYELSSPDYARRKVDDHDGRTDRLFWEDQQ